jgi:hypothetical protein
MTTADIDSPIMVHCGYQTPAAGHGQGLVANTKSDQACESQIAKTAMYIADMVNLIPSPRLQITPSRVHIQQVRFSCSTTQSTVSLHLAFPGVDTIEIDYASYLNYKNV